VLKITGLTESETDRRLSDVHAGAGDVEWTILASPGQIEIHLRERVRADATPAGIARLDHAIEAVLGEHLFGRDDETIESTIARLAVAAGVYRGGGRIGHRRRRGGAAHRDPGRLPLVPRRRGRLQR